MKNAHTTMPQRRRRKPVPGAPRGAGRGGKGDARGPAKQADLRRRLVALREHLLEESQELIRDSKSPVGVPGSHLADVATDEAQRDLDLSLLTAEQDALFEIGEALRRIEDGTYGICELSGKPIPEARLEAVPWTRFTTEAETELEKRGVMRKAHLGELALVETEPEALSRTLEEIQPPEREVTSASLADLEQSAPGEEQPGTTNGETRGEP